jgi:hypothetical protein
MNRKLIMGIIMVSVFLMTSLILLSNNVMKNLDTH